MAASAADVMRIATWIAERSAAGHGEETDLGPLQRAFNDSVRDG